MGLLDNFNLDDPQTMGLLSAAANMFGASGPSRTPTSLGQILGGGFGAFANTSQAAKQQKMKDEEEAQMKQMRAMNLSGMQSDMMQKQAAQVKAGQLDSFYKNRANPDMGAMAAMGDNLSPTLGNADKLAQFQSKPQAQPGGAQNIFAQRMQEAQDLRDNGFHERADTVEKSALAFQPKVKNWEKVNQDGKVMYAPFFENGGSGAPVPLEVAEKLEFRNLGGKTVGVNPFTGKEISNYAMSQSPDSIASNAISIRGQNMTDSRAREAGMAPEYKQDADGNWLALPKKIPVGGKITAMPVFGADGNPLSAAPKPLTESQGKATGFGSRMQASDAIINELIASGTKTPSLIKSGLDGVPFVGGALGGVGNLFASNNQQKMEQAKRDFINANLRNESGASIQQPEFNNADKQYFPQVGDSNDVIAQKARNRKIATNAMAIQAGPGAKQFDGIIGGSPQKKSAIKGQVMDGYKFKGGDPSDQSNWEKM